MKKILLALLAFGFVASAVAIPAHAQANGNAQDVQAQQSILDVAGVQDEGMEAMDEEVDDTQENESEMNESEGSDSEMNESRSVERGPPQKSSEGPVKRGPPAFVQDLMPSHVLDRVPSFFWN